MALQRPAFCLIVNGQQSETPPGRFLRAPPSEEHAPQSATQQEGPVFMVVRNATIRATVRINLCRVKWAYGERMEQCTSEKSLLRTKSAGGTTSRLVSRFCCLHFLHIKRSSVLTRGTSAVKS